MFPKYSYEASKYLKNSKVVEFKGYKHLLPLADKKEVAKEINIFILNL